MKAYVIVQETVTDEQTFADYRSKVIPTVGTMRLNRANEGSLGSLEELYGMQKSSHHPAATSVCTKFIVRKSHRYGQASFKLMATSVDFGIERR